MGMSHLNFSALGERLDRIDGVSGDGFFGRKMFEMPTVRECFAREAGIDVTDVDCILLRDRLDLLISISEKTAVPSLFHYVAATDGPPSPHDEPPVVTYQDLFVYQVMLGLIEGHLSSLDTMWQGLALQMEGLDFPAISASVRAWKGTLLMHAGLASASNLRETFTILEETSQYRDFKISLDRLRENVSYLLLSR